MFQKKYLKNTQNYLVPFHDFLIPENSISFPSFSVMSYEAVLIVPIYCTLSRALAILKIISSEQLQYVHCSGSKFILPLLSLLNVQTLPRVNKYCSILHYSTGGYCVRTVQCTHADFLHDLQMICFRSDMQNRTTFVNSNSKAILDMKK